MKAREYLLEQLENEAKAYIGYVNKEVISSVAEAWMNDEGNSKHRFEVINQFFPEAGTILDMASGCGTCVFYGLINGYDMYGIDPERWKNYFIKLKTIEKGYPMEWLNKFYAGKGEDLPFANDFFDCCITYQTLEHVKDPKKCILEMLRVTKTGGGIHIMCPDYYSTYEGHYLLPWLPLLNRSVAKMYLRLIGRSFKCLDEIKYVTTRKIFKWLKEITEENDWRFEIIDVNKHIFYTKMLKRKIPVMPGSYLCFRMFMFMKNIFRNELQTNLIVRIVQK